MQRYEKKST